MADAGLIALVLLLVAVLAVLVLPRLRRSPPKLPPPPEPPAELPASPPEPPEQELEESVPLPPWSRPTPPLLPRAGTEHPIVLAHGLLGFDAVGGAEYFRGIAESLRRMGADVHTLRVSPIASVETRAKQLAEQIDRLGHPKVNVIAHSMGGIDARYAIARLGLSSRVASLTTIGTPHRGTPLADAGSVVALGEIFRPMLGVVRADAFYDLTTKRMARFNDEIRDVRGVDYSSYVASASSVSDVSALLVPSYLVLRGLAGENDGIVPAKSQPWGDVLGELAADHWAQIGWTNGFDAAELYRSLVRELRGRGH